MEEKHGQALTRSALAEQLESLAAQLRSGHLAVEGARWRLSDAFEAKVRVKEKRGQIRFKLEWRCSTLESYEPDAVEAVTRWRSGLKDAKKAMARSFKELKKAMTAGGLADEGVLADFERQTAAFLEFAEPEWRLATEEFVGHLENLKRAVTLGHQELIQHELRDLESRMVACHREFK